MKKFIITTSNGKIIQGYEMYEIVKQLPLFNSYISQTLEELIESITEDLNIEEDLISAIKSNEIEKLNGLFIDDYISIKVSNDG